MPVSVYEALSVMFQFGLWIFALLTFVVTLLIYLHKKNRPTHRKVHGLFRYYLGCKPLPLKRLWRKNRVAARLFFLFIR
ncbi:putative holin-like toxin [Paenibacillus thiaminolyticus]|uniref:putative holin-like toxin n=1 Tax=Paenibacillus thiaminolyticus TaxID=49283 RepID=UPI003D6DA314